MSRLSSLSYGAVATTVVVPCQIVIYEHEYEKNQIRSHAYVLRLFLFSAFNFRIPDTRNLTPDTKKNIIALDNMDNIGRCNAAKRLIYLQSGYTFSKTGILHQFLGKSQILGCNGSYGELQGVGFYRLFQ